MRGHVENEMRRQAQMAMLHVAPPRLGIVTSYDPAQYAVKVKLQPDGTETGWIQLKSQWVGNGWGLFCPPINGAQVEVTFEKADIEAGLCGSAVYSDQDRPLPVPQGECWLVHQSGAYVKLTNSAGLQLADGAGATLTLNQGVVTVVATSILLGEGATEPVQLASGQPSTLVKAI